MASSSHAKSWLHSIRRGESAKSAAKLVTGSTAAQLVAIGVAPVLTRLYSPTDFGTLATFTAITGFVLGIAAGRYETAIMLPEREEEATRIAYLAMWIVAMVSALTLAVVGVTYPWHDHLYQADLGLWAFLIPLTVLAGGWSAVFVNYATRRGEFTRIASTTFVRSVAGVATQITLGLLKVGAPGLLLGNFIGVASANARLARPLLISIQKHRPTLGDLRSAAGRYSQFPRHTLPATVLGSAAAAATPLLIGALFGVATLGLWALAQRIMFLPSQVVGQAVAQTYYRRAVQLRTNKSAALSLFDRTTATIALGSAVPFIAVGLALPWLFTLAFGEEWTQSAIYAQAMLPWIWARLIASPVSQTTLVYERNRWGLLIQLILVACSAVAATAAVLASLNFIEFLILLSALNCACYLLFLLVWRQMIKAGWEPEGVGKSA